MASTLAFDVYGTLIDTQGVVARLEGMVAGKAAQFSSTWRDKQLEYSFRRGLMRKYADFAICTSHALDYTCSYLEAPLDDDQKQILMEAYRTLPAFDDVKEALGTLRAEGYRLYAFSNGSAEAVETLLSAAGIREFFIGVISVESLKSFKPDPAVYHYFLRQSGASADSAWLISSNPFDVIGAMSAGMRAAWVRRSKQAVFDPWGMEPVLTVESLLNLHSKIGGYSPGKK
jgi:2-haloacid dehalogenase